MERGRSLAGFSRLVVVAGEAHAGLVRDQLGGDDAEVLLEPLAQDTAAAIAAAASWIARTDPDAVMVVLPADHHVPDTGAFAEAVARAVPAAEAGAIVTLGLRPQAPSEAMGYIIPGAGDGPALPVAAFVEKPGSAQAVDLIAHGGLWNSGVFIGRASTFRDQIVFWAPDVGRTAAAAAAGAVGEGGVFRLAGVEGPRIAFDRAVMEKTDRASVLPVDFAWSDLGAWDAVMAAAPEAAVGPGASVSGGGRVLVRAAPGVRVAVVGLSDVAVVAEPDAVLVTALGEGQAVRDAVRALPPARPFASLADAGAALDLWLRTAALPLWGTVGSDRETGAFREALSWTGAPADTRRRARVQARQAFVFGHAAAAGLPGPWLAAAQAGMRWFLDHGRCDDGLFVSALEFRGAPGDPTPRLYEHAFILLALSALHQADPDDGRWLAEAGALRERLGAFQHAARGFREAGDAAFQANAQMHLLEASLAWEAVDADPAWAVLSDEVAELALTRLIDADGVLHEFFDADWQALRGEADLIEPGHQFEWAWLLERWGAARGRGDARATARRLFAAGRRGFDPARNVVVNALTADLSVRDAGARLWPQTEHLKAALALSESQVALEAANGLAVYLQTPARGVWRERMRADGGFVEEPSPATSLYHLFLAIRELARACA